MFSEGAMPASPATGRPEDLDLLFPGPAFPLLNQLTHTREGDAGQAVVLPFCYGLASQREGVAPKNRIGPPACVN